MEIENTSTEYEANDYLVYYLCTSCTTNSGSLTAEEETKQGVRRERAKRTMMHERGAIFSVLFVLSRAVRWESGELWVNGGGFIERKSPSIKETKIVVRKAESNGVIKFFQVGSTL